MDFLFGVIVLRYTETAKEEDRKGGKRKRQLYCRESLEEEECKITKDDCRRLEAAHCFTLPSPSDEHIVTATKSPPTL